MHGIEMLLYEDPLNRTNQLGLISKGSSKVVYIFLSKKKS